MLVRGIQGELRGFYNVCRHRAGPPAEGCGSRKLFRCGYHGWTYGLDGSLISAPEFEGQSGFDAKEFALVPVRAEEWFNLIFVNLDPDAEPLINSLGQLPAQAERFGFAGMKLFERRTYDMKCNWKTYVDNYLEGYHLPSVHPGLNRELDYNAYTVEPYDRYVRQFSPIRGAQAGDATPRRYQEAAEDLTTDYFWIFPNWMLNCYPDNVSLNIVVADGCRTLAGNFRVVSAGERPGQRGGQGVGGIQRSDSDRGSRHLRDRSEKPALAKLPARALQHQAGERCARVPPYVRRRIFAEESAMSSLSLLQSLHENLSSRAQVKSVFGEPITAGDKTIIPVAKIAYGFGGGTGSGGLEIKTARGEGGGGGGGVGVLPVGVFEVGPEGTRFVAIGDRKKLLGTLLLGAGLGLLFARRRRANR